MRIEKLNENTKKNLLDDLLKRSPNNYGKFEASVQEILNAVKEKGDEAVFDYTEKFDAFLTIKHDVVDKFGNNFIVVYWIR